MNPLLFLALSFFSLLTFAEQPVSPPAAAPTQDGQYDYSQDLDIAKVIRIKSDSRGPNECGPVKAQIEYVDSKGVTHHLEYTRLGDDCQNG